MPNKPCGLVRLRDLAPGLRVALAYAENGNFLGRALYDANEAWLLEETALKVAAAQAALERRGLGLLVLDAFRPLAAQRLMWEALPDEDFVAPPSRGSIHNRGAAVDLSLVDAAGRELPMPCPFDEFSPRASHGYTGGSPEERDNRALLRETMEAAGLRHYAAEWWHYSDPALRASPLLDLGLAELERMAGLGD